MKLAYEFILIGVIIILFVLVFIRYKKPTGDLEGNPLNPEAIKQRRENLDKIMELARTSPRLTNKIVTESLKVSEATATRYFEYLVTLGKLTRINDRGREVYYQLPQK